MFDKFQSCMLWSLFGSFDFRHIFSASLVVVSECSPMGCPSQLRDLLCVVVFHRALHGPEI